MEALFEAPHGSLKGFDCEGNPILEGYYGDKNTKRLFSPQLWIILENIGSNGAKKKGCQKFPHR